MSTTLVMLGAGDSTRFGLKCKKQWLYVGSEPLWLYATKRLAGKFAFDKVIVVGAENAYMAKFCETFCFVNGGKTRSESLQNALNLVESEFVLVSDIARACVPFEVVEKVLAQKGVFDCVVPFLPVNDTTLLGGEFVKREELKRIQTPQLSRVSVLKKAFLNGGEFTDESTAVASTGGSVGFVAGSVKAEKLTFFEDLKKANLPAPSSEVFVGNGFDVHKFRDGDHLTICGVKIPFGRAFEAHSDGDVGIHALIDALLGAANLGDVGELFPDTDKAFKGIDSKILLEKVVQKVRSVGFEITNCDITIIAQAPKISPFKEEMARVLARVLGVLQSRVSVKATTTERLGFTGRGEGVAASAVASLRYFDWTSV